MLMMPMAATANTVATLDSRLRILMTIPPGVGVKIPVPVDGVRQIMSHDAERNLNPPAKPRPIQEIRCRLRTGEYCCDRPGAGVEQQGEPHDYLCDRLRLTTEKGDLEHNANPIALYGSGSETVSFREELNRTATQSLRTGVWLV
jgi:hypothetical protein